MQGPVVVPLHQIEVDRARATTNRSNILVRPPGARWRSPDVRAYDNEAHLQAVLAEHPGLLPGVEDGASAVTELPVPDTGMVDLAVVDRQGALTLVECKLASNPLPTKTREQAFDVDDSQTETWLLR